jgi:hypothetical protein
MATMNTISKPEYKRWVTGTAALTQAVMVAAVLSVSFASDGIAQSQDTVTLRYDDSDDDGITGELIAFSNGLFRIRSSVGQVVVPAEGVSCIGQACPEDTRLETTGDQLVLTSLDGSVTVTGALLEISDDKYVLATDVGEMRIDVSKVICEGDDCLTEEDATYVGNVVLTGAGGTIEGILIDNLADAYLVDVPVLGMVRIKKDGYDCTGSGCP